jgi:hypothetical protein
MQPRKKHKEILLEANELNLLNRRKTKNSQPASFLFSKVDKE